MLRRPFLPKLQVGLPESELPLPIRMRFRAVQGERHCPRRKLCKVSKKRSGSSREGKSPEKSVYRDTGRQGMTFERRKLFPGLAGKTKFGSLGKVLGV